MLQFCSMANPNNNKQKQQAQQADEKLIQYDGLNDVVNFIVLTNLTRAMQITDEAWYNTFFIDDSDNPHENYVYIGMEQILNFYKPFKQGILSWQINEDEWHKKSEIDAKCRKQMRDYYHSLFEIVDKTGFSQADTDLGLSLSKQLLNRIYNSIKSFGGHTSPISIGDFRKDKNKGSGILWTNEDIDWNAYHAKVAAYEKSNRVAMNIYSNYYKFMLDEGYIKRSS